LGGVFLEEKIKAARLSIFSNTLLVILKLVVGIVTHSVSIISEAIHSSIDLVAALIAYFSVQEAQKPPDELHRYGHGKIENISGTVEGLLIFVAAIWIIYEAVNKLLHGGHVTGLGWGLLVMAGSALVNWLVSAKLFRVAAITDSVALRADALHLRTDVYTMLGVFAGLLLIQITGEMWLDPVAAIIVSLFIFKEAWHLSKEAIMPLMDVSLPESEEKIIRKIINDHASEFLEFHKLRTRKAGSQRHIDLHLVVPKGTHVEEVYVLVDHMGKDIEARFPNTQVMMHVEPCKEYCEECSEAELCRK